MLNLKASKPIDEKSRGAVIAIGNFDGLHRGHQELLNVAKSKAEQNGVAWGIVTFEPHPRSFFRAAEPVFRLTPPALKKRLAKALGAEIYCSLDFDAALAAMEPEEFIATYLVQHVGVSHVVTGYDFHFGKGRKGSPETLKAMGEKLGFSVTVVDQVTDDGDGHSPFASSTIRSALRRGQVTSAARDLGYRWTVMGEVVPGDQRGRTIGFPTANIILDPGAEPFRGIYAVEVRDSAAPLGTQVWQGAAYFGDRPTFNTNRTFLETYLLDQDIDLYGKVLMVSFHDMIRGDKAFKSVDELIIQMKADCEKVRDVLARDTAYDPIIEFPLGKLQRAGQI